MTGGEKAFQEEQTAAGKRQQVAGLTGLETWDTDRVPITGADVFCARLTVLSRWLGVPGVCSRKRHDQTII